jgi:hypothetical protein
MMDAKVDSGYYQADDDAHDKKSIQAEIAEQTAFEPDIVDLTHYDHSQYQDDHS